MSDSIPEQYRPRKCHVVKWSDFNGYGFNLHAEKGKAGQFIGKVDENSPAEKSGLKEGDRIVEVNGINIGNENHQQVVTRIKSGGEETTLLVVDTNADNWFKEQKKVIRGDLPDVTYRSAKREVQEEESPEPEVPPEEPEPPVVEPEPPVVEPEPPVVESEPEIVAVAAPVIESAPVNGDVVTNGDSEHRPRLCHLKIWPTFQGYGFNLHAERDKPGQYIGLVDDNSPASTAGMKVHDRIVEVNGVNVEKESHMDVISRIKGVPGEAKLLVVDRDADAYYRDRGVTVASSMPQTEYIVSPDTAPDVEEVEEEPNVYVIPTQAVSADVEPEQKQEEEKQEEEVDEADVAAQIAVIADEAVEEEKKDEEEERKDEVEEKKEELEDKNEVVETVVEPAPENIATFVPPPPPAEEPEVEEPVNGVKSSAPEPPSEPEYTVATQQQAVEPPPPAAATAAPPAKDNMDGLELNMSVSEMKERLKAKKRQDPRLNKISFEQKYKAFQRM